ncbi:F-actin-capping protein subunit alpha [Zea mays]|nr:F-actin-capping protein subunit alpha [Zea mays]
MKQTCTKLRPAEDEELPSAYIEEFRCALDVELSKYVSEAYPKGACAVYCTSGKDIEGPGADFSFAAVISAAKRSPQNFWYCLVHVFCLFLVPEEICHIFLNLAHMDQLVLLCVIIRLKNLIDPFQPLRPFRHLPILCF